MTALIVTVLLNTDPEAAGRGYMVTDVVERACEIRWGFLGRDLHGDDLRLRLPSGQSWDLNPGTTERIATAVLTAMRSPREDLEDWQREAIRPWLDSGSRPFAAGDVMQIRSPSPYKAERWDALPAALARMYGNWWRSVELEEHRAMTDHAELNAESLNHEEFEEKIGDAIDLASDQDQATWITDHAGKRIAALVPADVLESHDRWLSRVMHPRSAAHEYLLAADRALSIPHPAHELSPGEPPCPGAPGEIERWANLLESIGIRDVKVVSVTREKEGRVVRLKLPRSGTVTVHRLQSHAMRIAVIMQVRSRDLIFRELDHAADIELRLNEGRT